MNIYITNLRDPPSIFFLFCSSRYQFCYKVTQITNNFRYETDICLLLLDYLLCTGTTVELLQEQTADDVRVHVRQKGTRPYVSADPEWFHQLQRSHDALRR